MTSLSNTLLLQSQEVVVDKMLWQTIHCPRTFFYCALLGRCLTLQSSKPFVQMSVPSSVLSSSQWRSSSAVTVSRFQSAKGISSFGSRFPKHNLMDKSSSFCRFARRKIGILQRDFIWLWLATWSFSFLSIRGSGSAITLPFRQKRSSWKVSSQNKLMNCWSSSLKGIICCWK